MSDVEMEDQPRRSGRQRKATQQYGNGLSKTNGEDVDDGEFTNVMSMRCSEEMG
jgi:hypothetical protein